MALTQLSLSKIFQVSSFGLKLLADSMRLEGTNMIVLILVGSFLMTKSDLDIQKVCQSLVSHA